MALITDLLTQATTTSRPTPTQVTSVRAISGTVLQCNALSGWATATAVHFITYKIDTSGNKIAGSQIDMKGIVSGTTITQIVIKAGSDVGNSVGDIVEAAPTAAWANDLYTWGSAHANQDGSLITSAVQTALGIGAGGLNGFLPLGYTPSLVVHNGNRSYTMTISGIDLTSTLSAGMRIRTSRTVAAPTQDTSLNGTNQFWNKTSPAGMTFTDDFVVSAYIKKTAYGLTFETIASRYNGTSGWFLELNNSGQVILSGQNAASANFSQVISSQSIPLNRWVHVAAQLDMSTFTASATTSYIMIDGVDVPCTVARGGTNPTALVQAGNLEIGGQNGGALPFGGKIAQVAVFNAKVTEGSIQSYMSQGLAGTETSLISAYSFNANANDLNTTNANNLTSNNGAAATNADSPFGYQAGGTISSTLDYAIVMAVSFSTNTTIIAQAAEGCTIPTIGGVNAIAYSSNKAPYGFPTQEGKWILQSLLKTQNAVTSNATYGSFLANGWALTVPVGSFRVGYTVGIYTAAAVETEWTLWPNTATTIVGLTNALPDVSFSTRAQAGAATTSTHSTIENGQDLTTQTIYTMYTVGATTSAGNLGTTVKCELYARNAYL